MIVTSYIFLGVKISCGGSVGGQRYNLLVLLTFGLVMCCAIDAWRFICMMQNWGQICAIACLGRFDLLHVHGSEILEATAQICLTSFGRQVGESCDGVDSL